MSKYSLSKATLHDLPWIMDQIGACRVILSFHQSGQWQGSEPSLLTLQSDIQVGQYYVFKVANQFVGGTSIMHQEPAYEKLIRGAWLNQHPYLVLHRFFVAPVFHGKGYGLLLLNAVEALGKKSGIFNFRLDTHEYNIPMKKLLLKAGYTMCGEVDLPQAGRRIVYHKVIGE
jgi:RimJ/RimL family protein N-acetyltransferase